MSSLSPSAVLASLDDSLALPFASLEVLKDVGPIDIEGVIRQLNVAAESNRKLRSLVGSVLPEASWQSREELDALLEEITSVSAARSRLVALATELQNGSIVHRRALRVQELNQLRTQAIVELRSQAETGKRPPVLPGPDADHWIEWACGLTEFDDAASLQTLRSGFATLDDFVANLEPGMWIAKSGSLPASLPQGEFGTLNLEVPEQSRHCLLALAAELERGNVSHHRAVRTNQLNRLREEAIDELRLLAKSETVAPILPGPEAGHWIEWACGLKEPGDAEALETLRHKFPRLDDFVANLELDMWVAGTLPLTKAHPEKEEPLDKGSHGQCRMETGKLDDPAVSSGPLQATSKVPNSSEKGEGSRVAHGINNPPQPVVEVNTLTISHEVESPTNDQSQGLASPKTNTKAAINIQITRGVGEAGKKKWLMALGIAAFVAITAYGAVVWRSHRNSIVPAKVSESDLDHRSASQGLDQSQISSESRTHDPSQTLHPGSESKVQDRGASSSTAPPSVSLTAADIQGAGAMSHPPMRVSSNVSNNEETPSSGAAMQTPSRVPVGLQNTLPSDTTGILRENSKAQPIPTPPKASVSPGGAQGLVIRRAAPLYPASARQAHVEGTVVLQALIGKDGNVLSVRVVSGHPMLIKAAVNAAKQWHFNPYYQDGEPVEADTQINVNFTLEGG